MTTLFVVGDRWHLGHPVQCFQAALLFFPLLEQSLIGLEKKLLFPRNETAFLSKHLVKVFMTRVAVFVKDW